MTDSVTSDGLTTFIENKIGRYLLDWSSVLFVYRLLICSMIKEGSIIVSSEGTRM